MRPQLESVCWPGTRKSWIENDYGKALIRLMNFPSLSCNDSSLGKSRKYVFFYVYTFDTLSVWGLSITFPITNKK